MKNVKENSANLSFSQIVFKKHTAFFPFCRIIPLELSQLWSMHSIMLQKLDVNYSRSCVPSSGKESSLIRMLPPQPLNTL